MPGTPQCLAQARSSLRPRERPQAVRALRPLRRGAAGPSVGLAVAAAVAVAELAFAAGESSAPPRAPRPGGPRTRVQARAESTSSSERRRGRCAQSPPALHARLESPAPSGVGFRRGRATSQPCWWALLPSGRQPVPHHRSRRAGVESGAAPSSSRRPAMPVPRRQAGRSRARRPQAAPVASFRRSPRCCRCSRP